MRLAFLFLAVTLSAACKVESTSDSSKRDSAPPIADMDSSSEPIADAARGSATTLFDAKVSAMNGDAEQSSESSGETRTDVLDSSDDSTANAGKCGNQTCGSEELCVKVLTGAGGPQHSCDGAPCSNSQYAVGCTRIPSGCPGRIASCGCLPSDACPSGIGVGCFTVQGNSVLCMNTAQ